MTPTTSVKLDPSKTWITAKSTWALTAACVAVVIVAYDFKSWVSNELHEVRKDQIRELNSINTSLARWESSFSRLVDDVGEIKISLKDDHKRAEGVERRLDRLEIWKMEQSTKK